MMMDNFHHMFAQYHDLCGPGCKSWIWVTEIYQCWMIHRNRATILVVDADRGGSRTCTEGSEQRGNLNSIQLCWEPQTTPKHRVKGRDKLQSGSTQCVWAPHRPMWVLSRVDWVFWESRGGRKVGVRWLEWRDTCQKRFLSILQPFGCGRSQVNGKPTHQQHSRPLWLTFANRGQTYHHSSRLFPCLFLHKFICKLTNVILFQYMYYVFFILMAS